MEKVRGGKVEEWSYFYCPEGITLNVEKVISVLCSVDGCSFRYIVNQVGWVWARVGGLGLSLTFEIDFFVRCLIELCFIF